MVKIATIGGGSSYTPELMEGFIKRYEQLPIKEIWFTDIQAGKEKLEIIGEMAQRMWDASPYEVKIHTTLDRAEALTNADFVTTQFRVGFLNARIKDERIPLSYGMLGQETNGAGGILKAFRTIPVMLDIVEDMKKYCPRAWLINFTNPSGMVTEAVVRYGKWEKVIGLCNIPLIATMEEPGLIDKQQKELVYQFAGLNHFHWHKVFDLQGNNVTRRILKEMMEKDAGLPKNIFSVPFFEEQLDNINMIPCGYHRYYYRQEEMLSHSLKEYQTIGTRGEQVKETESQLFELYKNPELHVKPEQLAKRGGAYYSDAACATIAAIHSNSQTQIVVSTINRGAVPDLPADCVVEVSANIGSTGAIPQAFGCFNAPEKGWLQLMKNMELAICEAAVTGNYGLALQSFIMNPLIPSGATAKRVLDELLIAHQSYLPQFEATIRELEAQGVEVKDEVSRQIMLEEQGG
ncbi:6-phospho-beta-glucosidase [Enterococcus florum]|uniref:6-phospho-beta-glucosidase n=1 Tax=Enterococcus florum TaxID=2480627 RepID=A0A4V0WPS1_9ENTE|nr:6-phospho-beta-glucosidase [Enterococcus florum]GCF94839.1 6-phospho-beta-glucosidase [Enterococcus florum]